MVQGPPQVEVRGDSQERLAQVNKDRDLRDGVRLEMSYLKPVEEEEPAEEGPYWQCEALLVEGPEDDRLRPVLRRELLPEMEILGWKCCFREDFPTEDRTETVVFRSFYEKGFALPAGGLLPRAPLLLRA